MGSANGVGLERTGSKGRPHKSLKPISPKLFSKTSCELDKCGAKPVNWQYPSASA